MVRLLKNAALPAVSVRLPAGDSLWDKYYLNPSYT
jgi:hypothetical protein